MKYRKLYTELWTCIGLLFFAILYGLPFGLVSYAISWWLGVPNPGIAGLVTTGLAFLFIIFVNMDEN